MGLQSNNHVETAERPHTRDFAHVRNGVELEDSVLVFCQESVAGGTGRTVQVSRLALEAVGMDEWDGDGESQSCG